jgi:hypothetical protein
MQHQVKLDVCICKEIVKLPIQELGSIESAILGRFLMNHDTIEFSWKELENGINYSNHPTVLTSKELTTIIGTFVAWLLTDDIPKRILASKIFAP